MPKFYKLLKHIISCHDNFTVLEDNDRYNRQKTHHCRTKNSSKSKMINTQWVLFSYLLFTHDVYDNGTYRRITILF